MSKNKEILVTTDKPSVYRKAFIKLYSPCPMCSPNRGCNRHNKNVKDCECWKSNRKTQWKGVDYER